MKLRLALAALLLAACPEKPQNPVCGLHSASAPVVLTSGKKERNLGVGAKLKPNDHVKATGEALLECFGGALKHLEKGDEVEVGELIEAKIESTNWPRHRIENGKLVKLEAMPRSVPSRYIDNQFTPETALPNANEPTTRDYFVAFFTPNGFDKMAKPPPDGPRNLPPPPVRQRVPYVHGGDLGEGPALLTVEDEVVFVETDDLATAALLEDRTYSLGRTVRVLLPKGSEASLELPNQPAISLEGPMDLSLR